MGDPMAGRLGKYGMSIVKIPGSNRSIQGVWLTNPVRMQDFLDDETVLKRKLLRSVWQLLSEKIGQGERITAVNNELK